MTQKITDELNSISTRLQESKSSDFSIYFLKRVKNQNVITYHVFKTVRTPELADLLKKDVGEFTQKINNRPNKIQYSKTLSMKRNELHYMKWSEVPHGSEIIKQCTTTNSNEIVSSKELSKDLWGYVIVVNFKNESIFAFNKYTESELINRKKRYYNIVGKKITALKENKYFELEKKFDAIVILPNQSIKDRIEPTICIANRFKFENFFSYKEYYQKYIEDKSSEFEKQKLIDDVGALVKRCLSNFQYSLRYSKILGNGDYKKMNIDEIKKYIQKYNLSVEIVDNKIKFDTKKIEEILELLEEDYYESELTSTKFKATDKMEI